MKRNARTIGLTVLAIGLAGCTHSDQSMSAVTNQPRRGGDSRRNTKLPYEEPPKILPRTYFAAGQLLERQGQYEAAMQQYRKALLVAHDYVAAQHRLGLVLSVLGQRDEALAALQRAVDLKPDNPVLRNNLGYELMMHQDWWQAEREFATAIELDPDFVRAHINRGLALAKMNRFEDAYASFRQVLPESDARYNVGLMYRADRRYEKAAESFNKVLSINPEFTAATVQLEQIAPRLEELRGVEAVVQAGDAGPFPALISVEGTSPDHGSPSVAVVSELTQGGSSDAHRVDMNTSSMTTTSTSSTWEPSAMPSGRPISHFGTAESTQWNSAATVSEMPATLESETAAPRWENPSSVAGLPTPLDVRRFEQLYQPEYAGPLSKDELIGSLSIVQNEIRCLEEQIDEFAFSPAGDSDVDWETFASSAVDLEATSLAFPAIESAAEWCWPSSPMQPTTRSGARTLGMTILEESSTNDEPETVYDLGPASRELGVEPSSNGEPAQQPQHAKPDPSDRSSSTYVVPVQQAAGSVVTIEVVPRTAVVVVHAEPTASLFESQADPRRSAMWGWVRSLMRAPMAIGDGTASEPVVVVPQDDRPAGSVEVIPVSDAVVESPRRADYSPLPN